MTASSDGPPSFVAVDGEAMSALVSAAADTRASGASVRSTTARLVELAEDFMLDATQRLRERGASEAQVERYEGAYREQVRRVRDAITELDSACERLTERAAALR